MVEKKSRHQVIQMADLQLPLKDQTSKNVYDSLAKLRTSLFLLGSFAIGYNAAVAVHELGHALSLWITGGAVARITLAPFSKSFTYYGSLPAFPLFTAWAGLAFSSAVGLLLLACFWTWRSFWNFPLMMIGLCAMAVNGLYFTIDSLLLAGGDATHIILLGTPRPLVLAVGTGLTLLCLIVGYLLLSRFVLAPTDGALWRLIILGGGVGPYLIAMLLYQIYYNQGEITQWLIYITTGILVLAAIACGSTLIDKWRSPWERPKNRVPTWTTTAIILGLAIIFLAAEMIVFGE
jgi:hypothetical protein